VAAGSGGDCDFDLRVVAGEPLELGFEEGAGVVLLERVWERRWRRRDVLHSSAATGPVAVVEVDALALEDEGADAVLRGWSARDLSISICNIYLWLCHCP
jgi:hypothetical protein